MSSCKIIIKDEVNVKYVSFDNPLSLDVALDLAITPELREEGEVRELVRMIQDIRKENGLTINDRVVLKVESDKKGQELVHKFKEDLIKTTGLKSITFVDGLQSLVLVGYFGVLGVEPGALCLQVRGVRLALGGPLCTGLSHAFH